MYFIKDLLRAVLGKGRRGRTKPLDVGRIETTKEDLFKGLHESVKKELAFFDIIKDLLRAPAAFLGKGVYGRTYKVVLGEGTGVVVKRLEEEVVVGKREFEQEMETIKSAAKHPNVAPLLGYYYDKNEKLLFFDYMASGSLSSLLHGTCGRRLDWESRLQVAKGIAKGIAHIHSVSGGKLTPGWITSSNVLVNQDKHGRVTDFGMALLMGIPTLPHRISGYDAPEVIESKKATEKSDVYSFGVLLFELLTGKAPVQSAARRDEVVDLPQWVESVLGEGWTNEVFDMELREQQNFDEGEMMAMLQIASMCAEKTVKSRPKMNVVVRMIEGVWRMKTR